jgi:hypothetical protein
MSLEASLPSSARWRRNNNSAVWGEGQDWGWGLYYFYLQWDIVAIIPKLF